MPTKEIKELRQAGKLDEALEMAQTELNASPDNIWAKRNISWVYYEYLKLNIAPENFETFISWLTKIKHLEFSDDEKVLFDQLCWQVGKMAFALLKETPFDAQKGMRLFEIAKSFHFSKPSEGYSFLFKAFHKILKETSKYIEFADWWGLQNFMPNDFEKEKFNDVEVMAIVEQAYINYAKNLLPQNPFDNILYDKEKALNFIPIIADLAEAHPEYQYPAYFHAKLLLAVGDKDNMLEALLPFAKKKRNDFWVWEILAQAFTNEPDKVFACYCKALSCRSPEEMLVNLRQKMAKILISKKMFREAKTEIELLVKTKNSKKSKIPNEVLVWQSQDWYINTGSQKSNIEFYKNYLGQAEGILFSDILEETVVVEFVNSDRKMLNFIASESKYGFFKYDRFLRNVKIGDVLKVRFQSGANEGKYQIYTAAITNDEEFKKQFIKEVEGTVKITDGKSFGFINNIFIHPSMVNKMKLTNGQELKATAIKSYNKEKKVWGWKLL